MSNSRRALIASTVIECMGAILFAIAKPHEWDAWRSVASVLHFPAAMLLTAFPTKHYVLAVILLQWLVWFILFVTVFFVIHIFRKKDDNAA
jgi:hypothetical protein